MTVAIYTLSVPSALDHLGRVRTFVAAHARAARLSPDAIFAVRLAVDEACTNVIKHAYEGNAYKTVEIQVKITPRRFTIIICDTGKPFIKELYTPPAKTPTRPGGWGIHIMRTHVDKVKYRSRKGKNETCLVMNRPR